MTASRTIDSEQAPRKETADHDRQPEAHEEDPIHQAKRERTFVTGEALKPAEPQERGDAE